jgi:hypothetical protein
MAAFVSGLVSGGVSQANQDAEDGDNGKGKGSKLKGILRKKKKGQQGGSASDYELPSFKRGGRVKRTGRAKVEKGEQVLTAKQARRYRGKRGSHGKR